LDQCEERLPRPSSTTNRENASFLRCLAHELLSPLTTLRLALQIGRTKVQRGESLEISTLDRALRQVDELVSLITQMREAARLARGDTELTPMEQVDLGTLLRCEVERFAHTYADRTITLECETRVALHAERRGIEQVVSSLLDNACKFSAPGANVRVVLSTSGDDMIIAISDPGIGVPATAKDKVFEMFYRAPNATQASAHGVGLGLFIAREIVLRHGGRIWCESELDRGSSFFVALPRSLAD
jgi:signal transduction histidine kinase